MTDPQTPDPAVEAAAEALWRAQLPPDTILYRIAQVAVDAARPIIAEFANACADDMEASLLRCQAERDALAATVAKIRALHQVMVRPGGKAACSRCRTHWPCDEVRILDGQPDGES